jgi:predicted GIY-YIG superfamily endonuclease
MEKEAFRCWKASKKEKEVRPVKRPKKRTCVNYKLKQGNKIVYIGHTNNPKRRIREHKNSGKRFTNVSKSVKVSRATAKKREKQSINRYKRSHSGRKPRYNKKG